MGPARAEPVIGRRLAPVRTIARVIAVERRLIRFEVEAFDDKRRIGEGRHTRGLVNAESFTRRFGGG